MSSIGVSNEGGIVFKNAVFLALFPTQQVARYGTGDEVLGAFLGLKQRAQAMHALKSCTRSSHARA